MAKRTRRTAGTTSAVADEFAETSKAIQARFGESSFRPAAQDDQPDRISTGVFMLDFALLGGIPHNRISMIAGHRHAGKSLLASKIIASAQTLYPDMHTVLLDIEGTFEPVWASKLGVDNEKLYVFHPETGESAVDAADALVRTREVSLVVVDSIAALTPMKEIETSVEDAQMALQARLVGRFIRKVNSGLIAERNREHFVTVLFLNQFRASMAQYGSPDMLPGGRALEFATSVQLIVKNKEQMGKDTYDVDTVAENEHSFDIKKNKLNSGPRTGEFQIRRIPDPELGLNEGDVDDAATMLSYAKKFGAYTGGGSSWVLDFWGETHRFRGVADAVAQLYQNRPLYWKLRNFLIHEQAAHLGMPESFLQRFWPDEPAD